MIYKAYTIHDRKALTYSPPFFQLQDGQAVRMLQDLVGDTGTQIGRHPADFVLYRIGTYDDSNGGMSATVLEHVVDAIALVPRPTPLPFDPGRGEDHRAETRFNGSGA